MIQVENAHVPSLTSCSCFFIAVVGSSVGLRLQPHPPPSLATAHPHHPLADGHFLLLPCRQIEQGEDHVPVFENLKRNLRWKRAGAEIMQIFVVVCCWRAWNNLSNNILRFEVWGLIPFPMLPVAIIIFIFPSSRPVPLSPFSQLYICVVLNLAFTWEIVHLLLLLLSCEIRLFDFVFTSQNWEFIEVAVSASSTLSSSHSKYRGKMNPFDFGFEYIFIISFSNHAMYCRFLQLI